MNATDALAMVRLRLAAWEHEEIAAMVRRDDDKVRECRLCANVLRQVVADFTAEAA